MSQDHNHLNHATWACKYHVVFTPKYRKKVLFGHGGAWALYSTSLPGRGVLRLDHRAERGDDPRLHQKSGDSRQASPVSRPRILYNRLWRFPFKPPALLGVIGFTIGCRRWVVAGRRVGSDLETAFATLSQQRVAAVRVARSHRHHFNTS